ncbi:hypothetical protein ACQUEF_05795 [Vagococcus fluvialis]|jgi:hypothetical protein|uniref:hypothetical protein n=1 Tax=Vagococcus fluvialis TaxID=2738 RepID=UPI003D0FD06E
MKKDEDVKRQVDLPIEIDLLFDNKKLDAMKYLLIMYQIKMKSNRRISFEELLYYYTLLYYETNKHKVPLVNKYMRDKKNINEVIIFLENLGYINLYGKISSRIQQLKISLTDLGIDSIESWELEILGNYSEIITKYIQNYPFGGAKVEFQNLLDNGVFS